LLTKGFQIHELNIDSRTTESKTFWERRKKQLYYFCSAGFIIFLTLMIETKTLDSFQKTYPQLELSSVDLEGFRLQGIKKELQAGQTLLGVQAQCELLPFVLDGGLRVYQSAASGREIILYHIHPGNSCILSALGILADRGFPAYAKADSATTLILMPGALLKRFVNHYPPWRDFVFRLYSDRFDQLIQLLQEVTFQRLDLRLVKYFQEKALQQGRQNIQSTHQKLAEELGSSREAVSRLLKDWENQGFLQLERGRVQILDPEFFRLYPQ
jgi:CRP/FNR family transcriptional regulator